MSQYATLAEFAIYGLPSAATSGLNPADITAQIVAASDFADSYLDSRGYAMPLASWGGDLRDAVCKIAAWNVLGHLRGIDENAAGHQVVAKDRDDAVSWLRDVAKGTANLVGVSPGRKATGIAVGFASATEPEDRGW